MLYDFDINNLVDIAVRGGPIAAIFAIILYGGFREKPWWVFGWVYRDLEKRHETLRRDRDDWKDTALAGTSIAKKLAELERRHR